MHLFKCFEEFLKDGDLLKFFIKRQRDQYQLIETIVLNIKIFFFIININFKIWIPTTILKSMWF